VLAIFIVVGSKKTSGHDIGLFVIVVGSILGMARGGAGARSRIEEEAIAMCQ